MALIDDLIAWWTLDEASGTRVDEHNGLDLTDNNTVGSATGLQGDAASFVAANSEYLSRADEALLSPTAAMTLAAWIYRDTNGTLQTIAAKWTYSSDGGWQIGSNESSADELRGFIAAAAGDTGSNTFATTDADLTEDAWHLVVMVYDGAGADNAARLKIYVNGAAKTLSFGGTIPAALQDSGAALEIGRFAGLGRYWNGLIDEVAMWSRALTSDEITEIYNGGAGLTYSDLVDTFTAAIACTAAGAAAAASCSHAPPEFTCAIAATAAGAAAAASCAHTPPTFSAAIAATTAGAAAALVATHAPPTFTAEVACTTSGAAAAIAADADPVTFTAAIAATTAGAAATVSASYAAAPAARPAWFVAGGSTRLVPAGATRFVVD